MAPREAAAYRGRIDAHVMECSACHAFARDSYRILSPSTTGPIAAAAAGGSAVEFGALAGAGGAGAGVLAWLGGVGGVKALTVLCAVSITTASVCGGVVAVLEGRDTPQRPERAPARVAAAPTPAPTAIRTRTPDPIRTAVPTPSATRAARPARTPTPARATTRTASQSQPAAPPTGSTGNEFDPVPAAAASRPAPVASGVGGEFAP